VKYEVSQIEGLIRFSLVVGVGIGHLAISLR